MHKQKHSSRTRRESFTQSLRDLPKTLHLKPLAAAFLLLGISLPLAARAGSQAALPGKAENSDSAAAESEAPEAVTNLAPIQVEMAGGGERRLTGTGILASTPLKDIPQPITVVSRQAMDAQAATNFQQALLYVPGITFAAAEGGTIGDNINLRGFNARTDVYLDGFRDRGQYYRDTFSLESIEVLEGPSSMLFGRGSTGGIVNQVSKLPSWAPHDELQATLGTSDQYRVTGDFDHPLSDAVAFRLPVMAQTLHSTRDVMHNEDYGAAPSLRIRVNPRTQVTFTSLFEHNHDMPDYGVPPLNGHPAPVSSNNFYGLTSDRTTQDVKLLGVRVRYEATPDLTLRNQVQYVRYRIDAMETAPGKVGACSAQPCAASDFTSLRTDDNPGSYTDLPLDQLYVLLGGHARTILDTSAYDQFDATWNFHTGPLGHTLVAGAELGRETYENQALTLSNLPVVSLAAPAHLSASQAGAGSTPGNLAQASANSYAAYANDTFSIGAHWKLVGGVRWDRFDAQLTNTVPSSRNPAAADQVVNHDSVRAGMLYQPTDDRTYYLSYGTSFDPALETLTVTNGEQTLPPETSRSYETGTKFDFFDHALSLNTALFQIRQSNAAVQIDTGVYAPEGDVRINGAEITLSGRITPRWQVFGGYTFLDGKITDDSALDAEQGTVPENTPRNNATFWTTYAFAPHWSMGGGLVWQSQRYANATNVVSVPSFVRWDATLAYAGARYEIRLNLLNLTNVHYFANLIQSDGGRAVPGVGRSALLTLTYDLD